MNSRIFFFLHFEGQRRAKTFTAYVNFHQCTRLPCWCAEAVGPWFLNFLIDLLYPLHIMAKAHVQLFGKGVPRLLYRFHTSLKLEAMRNRCGFYSFFIGFILSSWIPVNVIGSYLSSAIPVCYSSQINIQ